MSLLFWCSLIIQGIAMTFDEFYFHQKRGLPTWERWGHPVDTLFFLLPFSVLTFAPPVETWRTVYIVLAVVSCLVITKDEWIHRDHSSAGEQWLHSVLFLLHPTVLISGFVVWEQGGEFLWIFLGVVAFCFYQLFFWNFYANRYANRILKA